MLVLQFEAFAEILSAPFSCAHCIALTYVSAPRPLQRVSWDADESAT
jgi:hypothetical protein